MKIGDKVRISYFGCIQVAEVVKLTATKMRVRFKNSREDIKEAWRPL